MSTLLQPDSHSGEYQIRPTPVTIAPTPSEPPSIRQRVDHVDLLRGLVMVIMVLDHVRDYLTNAHFDPTDLLRTDLALFGTRWITHFCAPIFIFLAGASAWIAGTRRTRTELTRFLVTRGLWLILLEFTLISFGWYFSLHWTVGARAQVIWAIGASMVILAGLIHLPRPVIAGFGLLLVLGHNLLDGITPESFGALAPLWHVLHVPGELGMVSLRYPLVPWVGVMALGFVAGPAVFSQDPMVSRRLAWVGGFLVFAFVELRLLNLYGDPSLRFNDGDMAPLLMSFLNTTKYPPSLLYLLMTLGPGLVALSLFRQAKGRLASVFVTFGRVPFLFYVAHLYLVHSIAVTAGLVQGFPASAMLTYFRDLPKDYGLGLPVVYLVWLGVVAALYPLCRRYAELKGKRREWWMSYL
jgi:uncharacterized membrane protein